MVIDLGDLLREGESDGVEFIARLVGTYHACVESRAELEHAMKRGEISMQEFLECTGRGEAVEAELGKFRFPPGDAR